jgi:hypothetical protein
VSQPKFTPSLFTWRFLSQTVRVFVFFEIVPNRAFLKNLDPYYAMIGDEDSDSQRALCPEGKKSELFLRRGLFFPCY